MIRRRGGPPEDMGHGAAVPSRYNRHKYRCKGGSMAYAFAVEWLKGKNPETVTHSEVEMLMSTAAVDMDQSYVGSLIAEAEWILWDRDRRQHDCHRRPLIVRTPAAQAPINTRANRHRNPGKVASETRPTGGAYGSH